MAAVVHVLCFATAKAISTPVWTRYFTNMTINIITNKHKDGYNEMWFSDSLFIKPETILQLWIFYSLLPLLHVSITSINITCSQIIKKKKKFPLKCNIFTASMTVQRTSCKVYCRSAVKGFKRRILQLLRPDYTPVRMKLRSRPYAMRTPGGK